MNDYESHATESTDVEPRTERALVEKMTVLPLAVHVADGPTVVAADGGEQ